jgi:membrane-associated phospholipid phosphatase
MSSFELRHSEWVLLAFFAYIAVLMPFFRDRLRMNWQPVIMLVGVTAFLCSIAAAQKTHFSHAVDLIRDWLPMGLTFLAFRQMELFVPAQYNSAYEHAWIRWDRVLLDDWGFKRAIQSLGQLIPRYLELCYLLVYGMGSFCVAVIWLLGRRREIDRFYIILLIGTLVSYGLFPYFPSRPPRFVFPEVGAPVMHNAIRTLNLFLLRKGSIHSAVFPSAHVSAAFSAAWAMFLVLPDHKAYGWGLLIYALSVAIATIYCRYHYAVDAVAGFGVSLIAALLCFVLQRPA